MRAKTPVAVDVASGIGESSRNTSGDAAVCLGETMEHIVPDAASALLRSMANEVDVCCLQLGLSKRRRTESSVSVVLAVVPTCASTAHSHRETSCRREVIRSTSCEATSCGDVNVHIGPAHWSHGQVVL